MKGNTTMYQLLLPSVATPHVIHAARLLCAAKAGEVRDGDRVVAVWRPSAPGSALGTVVPGPGATEAEAFAIRHDG